MYVQYIQFISNISNIVIVYLFNTFNTFCDQINSLGLFLSYFPCRISSSHRRFQNPRFQKQPSNHIYGVHSSILFYKRICVQLNAPRVLANRMLSKCSINLRSSSWLMGSVFVCAVCVFVTSRFYKFMQAMNRFPQMIA